MSEIISINDKEVMKIEFNGKPVVSCSMVDSIHNFEEKRTIKAFGRHKSRFVEGKHYHDLPYEAWSGFMGFDEMVRQTSEKGSGVVSHATPNNKTRGGHTGNMIFLTDIGYSKLIKVFNDDLSWEIYDLMVENYFNPTLQRIAVPADPQQVLGMRAWLRSRLKSLQADTKSTKQMLNECEEKLDKIAPPFLRPRNEQLALKV